MHAPVASLLSKEWYCGSYAIRLAAHVPHADIVRMKTRGQIIRGTTIYVRHGKVRDTDCGMIECRDRHGMPFGWNKCLIVEITAHSGVIWPP